MNSFIGEIKAFPYNYAPKGWLACNGNILPAQQYQALYSVIGNAYGGNAGQTFALPNLNGQILNGAGTLPGGKSYPFAGQGGTESVTLTQATIPSHTHNVNAGITTTNPATAETKIPGNTSFISNIMAQAANIIGNAYQNPPTTNINMSPNSVGVTGGNAAHENRAAYLPITYCICITDGDYPSRP